MTNEIFIVEKNLKNKVTLNTIVIIVIKKTIYNSWIYKTVLKKINILYYVNVMLNIILPETMH